MYGKSNVKTKVYFLVAVFILLAALPEISAGTENLDEFITRKPRKATATFYSGENCTTKPVWNPMMLHYTDIVTGAEVWKITNTADKQATYGLDIGMSPWSADGKRMAWMAPLPTSCFNSYASAIRMFQNTDGSFLIPAYAASKRWMTYNIWSPVEPDSFYEFGSNGMQEGKDNRILYRNTLSTRNSVTATPWLTFPWPSGMYAPEDMFKGTISADGKKAVVLMRTNLSTLPVYPVTLLPEASKQLDDPDGWLSPQIDTYWGDKHDTNTVKSLHDMYIGGTVATKIWWYFMPQDAGVGGSWWRMTLNGSAPDGGPLHTQDHTAPYDWGGEIEPIYMNASSPRTEGTCGTNKSPWMCDNDPATDPNQYISHLVVDRWGTKVAGGYVNSDPCIGFSIFNTTAKTYDNRCVHVGAAGHYAWNGWTDWVVGSPSLADNNGGNGTLHAVNYTNSSTLKAVAKVHVREGGSTSATYQSLPRVGQSPDGTKAAYVSDFLGNVPNQALDVFWTVVYYPYPPEIKSATKSGGTVRLTWDFNQGSAGSPNFTNPRTYATRGWPHETNDRPPSPREIDKFRVWVSSDISTWTPVGTATYNNCRGNNECGMWTETAWTYDIAQPMNSTRYYALSSLEHSGLESRTLGNVWKVALDSNGLITQQIPQSSYPDNPGGKTNFYTTKPGRPANIVYAHQQAPATTAGQYTITWSAPADKTMIRYYNIYAADGTDPSPIQQRRIASIPATSDYAGAGNFKYIDWLGNPTGSTKYSVTAVDYQGNESPTAGVPAPPTGVKATPLPQ